MEKLEKATDELNHVKEIQKKLEDPSAQFENSFVNREKLDNCQKLYNKKMR